MSRQPLPSRRERGSVLIVALLLCAVIGLSLVSYLRLGGTTVGVANRAFYHNAAINLAETGLEQAMWSINKARTDPTEAWADWSGGSSDAWATFPKAGEVWEYGQNTTGTVRVLAQNLTSPAPRLVARATISPAQGDPIEKWIEVTLRKRSKFSSGLVARDTIMFRGNRATVDSWNSDPDGNGISDVPYSAAVRRDNGSVGSISVSVDSVLVNHADVWGFVSTGGDDPSDNVGSNGSILGEDSPAGSMIDPERIATDFTADLSIENAPAGSYTVLPAINGSIELPTNGANTGTFYYRTSGISLSGNNKRITVRPGTKVILEVTGDTSIGGNSNGFYLPPDAKLEVWTAGDFDARGNGVVNGSSTSPVGVADAQAPANFALYGTNPSGQEIDIGGTAAFSGIIYAPSAAVKIHGNVDALGSIVANAIEVLGNCQFHYDESLADLDTGNPFGITKWKELTTAAERSAYAADLSF